MSAALFSRAISAKTWRRPRHNRRRDLAASACPRSRFSRSGFSLSRLIDNGLEIGFHLRNRQSAESIIGAQRENENVDLFLQHPVEPRQAARGCVAAHPGVDHFEGQIPLPDLLLDERRGRPAPVARQARRSGCRRETGSFHQKPAPQKSERGKRENKNPTAAQFPHAHRITIA